MTSAESLSSLSGPAPGFPVGGLVVFIVVLLAGAALLHRRFGAFGASRSGQSLKLLSSLALGDKRAIVLVEAERQRMLVGVTGQSVQLICRLRASETAEDAVEAENRENDATVATGYKGAFGALLERALGRGARP